MTGTRMSRRNRRARLIAAGALAAATVLTCVLALLPPAQASGTTADPVRTSITGTR